MRSGHVEPQVYDGPTISVISSAITSSQFTAQLRLSNSTTWSAGSLNIDSSDAPIIWAYGTNSPSNPSSPSSDFTQHRAEGQFSLNMKAAQVQEASPSTTTAEATASGTAVHSEAAGSSFSASTSTLATATTSISAPVITGVPIDYSDIGTGLTSYDKVMVFLDLTDNRWSSPTASSWVSPLSSSSPSVQSSSASSPQSSPSQPCSTI